MLRLAHDRGHGPVLRHRGAPGQPAAEARAGRSCSKNLKRGSKVVIVLGHHRHRREPERDGEDEMVLRSEDPRSRCGSRWSPKCSERTRAKRRSKRSDLSARHGRLTPTPLAKTIERGTNSAKERNMQRNFLRGLLICLFPCLLAAVFAVFSGASTGSASTSPAGPSSSTRSTSNAARSGRERRPRAAKRPPAGQQRRHRHGPVHRGHAAARRQPSSGASTRPT